MNAPISHSWTRKEILQAGHDFEAMIKKSFGEVWKLPRSAEYVGKSWDCRTPIAVDAGLWRLVEAVRHAGGLRAAGRMELRDAGTTLRFIIFYNPKDRDDEEKRIIL